VRISDLALACAVFTIVAIFAFIVLTVMSGAL